MLMRKKYTGLANCYAFSIKLPTDPQTGEPFQKRPQPGDFSDGYASPDLDGFMEKVYNECDADLEGLSKNIINAVIEDGQVLGFTITKADSANACAKGGAWVIALGFGYDLSTGHRDYHWWRRMECGFWFHKNGGDSVSPFDDLGRYITDPQKCNRGLYSYFLGYFLIEPTQNK